jgi:hypothetical protein
MKIYKHSKLIIGFKTVSKELNTTQVNKITVIHQNNIQNL